ncbi:MAG TPA: carboxypeptidase regulatory-like domain-containing protein, partial [Thermoanaerobaculia bacterium]|nr:carboxypeptidase regulatory-like domain-containing protein [Thermoanaerobaculia bacterium]
MKNRAIPAIAAFLVAAAAFGGNQGRLNGLVTGPDGKPLANVLIVITTPNITTFKLTAKTDATGHYGIIVNDATIPYKLHFELEGYVPYEENKKIATMETTTLDVQLKKPVVVEAPLSTSDQAAVAYNEGVELLNGGDKAGAEGKFRAALAKNPDLPQAWQALAVLAYEKKDWGAVLEAGQKATDLDPTISSLYEMMSVAAQQKGDKKAAAEWRAKFAEANPDTPETIYNKGVEALNSKRMQEAADYFT